MLTLNRYLVIGARSRRGDGGGVGVTIAGLHRLGREDDVRPIGVESDILVGFSVEVYGLKLQLGVREGLELGKAHVGTKGCTNLADREFHGQYEGVPAVLGERLGKVEYAVLVVDAILQILQVATKLVEDQVLVLRVAGVEHAEVIEHRPLVGVGRLVGVVGVADVEAEGDASTFLTSSISILDHLIRHLYDHAIVVFV